MTAQVYDTAPCDLGEGPLWHPQRQTLFWFDITGRQMFARSGDTRSCWTFDEMHSAAGWIDENRLLIASETGLWIFDTASGARDLLCPLEAANPVTRSNDGRADPQGGFWIGTMGKNAESRAGAIWRWYRGELRLLYPGITISNAICFPPGGHHAHFTDTVTGKVMKVALDADGWPAGDPQVWLDLTAETGNPDGAVVDASGTLWLAEWGAGRVAAYDPEGRFVRAVEFAAPHTSCPAFGGPGLDTLYCTSALQGMTAQARAQWPDAGTVQSVAGVSTGQPEHRVVL